MGGPLEGIRVIDCTHWLAGPVGTKILGDLGADVIKIEKRIGGDPARGAAGFTAAAARQAIGTNYFFNYANRNKRSLTLDLRMERGKQIMHKLVEKADVFVHNWRRGVPERLGLDYETLSGLNPRLIYAEATGFGSEGPVRMQPAFEVVVESRAGMVYMAGEPDSDPMIFVTGLGDHLGGMVLADGILAAICSRARLGVGQKVETSIFGSIIAWESPAVSALLDTGVEFPRRSRARTGNPLVNNYRCADGKRIALAMVASDRYWSTFCRVTGIQDLEKDLRFENMDMRSRNAEELISILDKVFATRTREEWLKRFEEEELICAPVQTISELVADPQALANDYVVECDHPTRGRIKVVGFPHRFSKTPASVRLPAPEWGQHTEEVLLEIRYTWKDIAELREQEIV